MSLLVIDASVGVKWIFDEELSEKARSLLERAKRKEIKVVVPGLFYDELANACWVRVKKELSRFEEVDQALERIIGLPLETYPDRELADVAFENAIQFNISAYDAIYLSLAEIYVAPLVTADETLLKACQGRFDFIESLAKIEI